MIPWKEMSEYYTMYADRKDTRDKEFGNGMLDLIRLLENDPAIQNMVLGRSMDWLLIALPDYDVQSIHIRWNDHETYKIFLTVDFDQIPDTTIVSQNEIVPKVKGLLKYLEGKSKMLKEDNERC